MRTTLTLDDDVILPARSLAHARGISLGAAVSELARRGLFGAGSKSDEDGFPVFSVPPGARAISLEDIKRLDDEP